MEELFSRVGVDKEDISYELFASSTVNYVLFRDVKIGISFLNIFMNQYFIFLYKKEKWTINITQGVICAGVRKQAWS